MHLFPARLLLTLSLALSFNCLTAQQSIRVLFIGNSYTGVNNLPQLTSWVTASGGDTLEFDASTPGGYTFQGHSSYNPTLTLLAQGGYDFVVLQEQSQLPSFPLAQVQSQCFPYAAMLDSLIRLHNPCAETVFYRTWGRKNGDASNCPNWPPVCTYAGMDSLLALRYQMMADDNDAFVAPVGEVWKYIRTQYPAIELYDSDESHPSPAGSYAAALTFYTTFLRKDPSLITYDYTLLPWIASDIRTAARAVVYDSLSKWNIGQWDPLADFAVSYPTPGYAEFVNASLYADQFIWDFGDGTWDTTGPGTIGHQYAPNTGPFMVTLRAMKCQAADTFSMLVNPLPVGISDQGGQQPFFAPNPADHQIVLNAPWNRELVCNIMDMRGAGLLQASLSAGMTVLDVHSLPPGAYILELRERNLPVFHGKLLICR
ncbi:MAG TPA: T9SS type A sorting domain-containing protein, partial [Bacteroidales bacterium]|nr:T9SS type A sorting domain-containing protein [Bacteroidales bacterium]HRZ76734.1 T9SS type A sorting domain-containing protein [Bacteroidales bacterium]